jgi:hypothetical protein
VAGEAQCRFCRAKTRCEAFSAFVGQVLPQPLTVERAKEVIEQAETILPAITDTKLGSVLDTLGLCERWIAMLRSEAKLRLKERPGSIPGWELKAGVTRALVTDVRGVWARWDHAWPDKTEEFLAAAKLGKGDLRDALRSVTGLKGKALADQFESLIAGCVTETVTSPRLLRIGEDDAEG